MSKDTLKYWIVPLGLWGLYTCWYFGFQAGYDHGYGDGYISAVGPVQSAPAFHQIAGVDSASDPAETSDSLR